MSAKKSSFLCNLPRMEHADWCCFRCGRWLDGSPFSPSCQDVHICGQCKNKHGSKCPLCLEETDQDHLQLDRWTVKHMQKTTGVCGVCSKVICLADFRKHRELCRLPEEEEGAYEKDQGKEEEEIDEDVKMVALPPEEKVNDVEKEPEEMQAVSCPYQPYGCLFQGTQEKLKWHLQTDACFIARMLCSGLATAQQQYREMQDLQNQIGALLEVLRLRDQ